MSEAAVKLMDVDEFLVWAEGREGKWELHDGVAVAMAPEQAPHVRVKTFAAIALLNAVRRAGAPYEALAGGMTVRISARRTFVPDASVICPPLNPDDIETSTPLIVVESSRPPPPASTTAPSLRAISA